MHTRTIVDKCLAFESRRPGESKTPVRVCLVLAFSLWFREKNGGISPRLGGPVVDNFGNKRVRTGDSESTCPPDVFPRFLTKSTTHCAILGREPTARGKLLLLTWSACSRIGVQIIVFSIRTAPPECRLGRCVRSDDIHHSPRVPSITGRFGDRGNPPCCAYPHV